MEGEEERAVEGGLIVTLDSADERFLALAAYPEFGNALQTQLRPRSRQERRAPATASHGCFPSSGSCGLCGDPNRGDYYQLQVHTAHSNQYSDISHPDDHLR